MSVFGRSNSGKKVKFGNRLEVFMIKLHVLIAMVLKKNAIVEKEWFDLDVIVELVEWSTKKGYSLEIKEKEYPIYVAGHHVIYEMHGTRHCTNLLFSK